MSVTELFDRAAAPKRADRITIRRPDDFHVHLRDGAMLEAVLPFTAAQFARGVIMPNLVPPVTSVAAAAAYRGRILAARAANSDFQPVVRHCHDLIDLPTVIEAGMILALMGTPAFGARESRQRHSLCHQQHVSEVEPIDQHRIEAA